MKVELKRAVKLGESFYKVGIHDIPEEHREHWFFQALEKDGHARILGKKIKKEEPKAEEPEVLSSEEQVKEEAAPEVEAAKPEGKKKKNGR